MKKKIFTAMMCVVIGMTTLVGCGKTDPKAELSQILEKSAKVEDIDMNSSMKMTLEKDGETLEMPVSMDIKAKDTKSDAMTMEMKMNMAVADQEIDMTTYYTDGYYYMDYSGAKMKYAMDIEKIREQLQSSMSYQELAADMFQEVTMEEKNGSEVFSFKGDLSKMEDYLEASLDTLKNTLGQDMEYKFSDVKGTLTAKDGEMKEMTLNFGMDLTMDGNKISAKTESTSKINATGDAVKISLPDFDDYQEINAPEE